MLTADLVKPSSRGGVLRVRRLDGKKRTRALEIAGEMIAAARALVGATRAEVEDATRLEVASRERWLMLGLRKLLDDRSRFEESSGIDPLDVRERVFAEAVRSRRAEGLPGAFDRDAVLATVAAELAPAGTVGPVELEAALFADLKAAHRLVHVDVLHPGELLERYDLAQAQAILLRATQVTAFIGGAEPSAYRALFQKLKFLRLLFRAEPDDDDDGGYRLEIDGPVSLFSQSTKYGLQLALALPSLAACPRCRIEADVKWGKQRAARRFEWTPADAGIEPPPGGAASLRDDVGQLMEDVNDRGEGWRAEPADVLLTLPGVGVCVPDLVFVNKDTGAVVYLEALGFWSREAVFKRVDLVDGGLDERIVFAASSRLRVSEAALPKTAPSALYVYKGVMSARQVLDRVAAVAIR